MSEKDKTEREENFYFGHKGQTISASTFSKIKSLAKNTGLRSIVIYRESGYFINKGNRPQQHYNYKPRY